MAVSESFNIYIINYWVLIPAVVIIIILSFLEKRKTRQDVCHGRPGLLIPFRFLDGYENRTAYAMAFGTATSTVVSLVTSQRTLEFDLPLWASALYVYLQAIIGCLTCYPLFACLTTRYRAVGAILCIMYSVLWMALKIVELVQVELMLDNAQTNYQSNNTITQATFKVYHVLQRLPILFCYFVLIIYCFYILHRCYTSRSCFNKRIESTVKVHHEEHVRWVFRKYKINQSAQNSMDDSPPQTFVDQMKDSYKLRYFTNFPFFKYPARMVALSFVQLNILYWAGLLLMMYTIAVIYPIIYAEFTQKYVEQYVVDLTVIISVCTAFALIVCILNALAQIFIGVRNYRFDMLRIYQGNMTFVFLSNKTPQNILTRSMTFPGYQMGFMLWGVLLCFTTVFLLTIIPVLCIYFASKLDVLDDVVLSLVQVLSFPAFVFAMFYLQVFMTKRVLLQRKVNNTDENQPLNVDNRKFYEIINYSSLFTNMAVGLFTCLFRIIQSAFFGIFAIARLDRSVFPHDLESWDRGYAAYISMLLVDNAHNNPCMRVFAHLLWTKTMSARLRRHSQGRAESSDADLTVTNNRQRHLTYGTGNIGFSPTLSHQSDNPWTFVDNINGTQRLSRASLRWFLAYTLINNPQLCKLRKQKLTKNARCDSKHNFTNTLEGCTTQADDVPLLVDIDNSTSSSLELEESSDDVMLKNVLHISGSSA